MFACIRGFNFFKIYDFKISSYTNFSLIPILPPLPPYAYLLHPLKRGEGVCQRHREET